MNLQLLSFPATRYLLSDVAYPQIESQSLLLQWLWGPKTNSLTDRVLARLIQSEAHEPDVWLREDYRETFIALSLAIHGSPIPLVEASYEMFGLHPDKVYPAILARREALLGRKFPKSTELAKEAA
jgi:hypothetical protein